MARNPSMFIGCSSEYRDIAGELQALLNSNNANNSIKIEAEIWDQGVFGASETALSSLTEAANRFDFATLILGKDATTTDRGNIFNTPRDNVLFELGLFMGSLGTDRTYIVKHGDVKIPSDLKGLTVLEYKDPTSTTLKAALGPAANEIIKQIRKVYASQPIIPSRMKISDHYTAWWDMHNSSRTSKEVIQTIDGLEIQVSSGTFSPNPRLTYSPIIAYKRLPKDLTGKKVLDLGTGCGVLAISAALRGAKKVIAIDNEPSAIEDASFNVSQLIQQNKIRSGVIEVIKSDLFAKIPDMKFDFILANLPICAGAKSWDGLGDSVAGIVSRCASGLNKYLQEDGMAVFTWASFGPPNLIPEALKEHGFECKKYTEETFGAEWHAYVAKRRSRH